MNPYIKLLKTTGAVCLSCVCLTSKANPNYMTLKEIKKLLETGQKQFETEKSNLSKLLGTFVCESKKIPDDELQTARGEKCAKLWENLKLYKNEIKNMPRCRRIEYNTEGDPTLFEFCGRHTLLNDLLKDLFGLFNTDSGFMKYNEERLKKWLFGQDNLSSLHKISKELNTKELKERGITNDEIGLFENASVREITFDSILESGFFSEEAIEKAKFWANHTDAIKKAIKEYVEKTTVLMSYKVTVSIFNYKLDLSPNSSDDDIVCKENYKEYHKGVHDLYFRATDAEILTDRLKEFFYSNNLYKNGREAIILLLLLDDMTPQECRLKWYIDEAGWSYHNEANTISIDMLDFYNNNGEVSLLHEIGHYLQECFGLKQTFESYQNPFAKKLLLLQDNPKENKKTVSSYGNPFAELQDDSKENEKTISVPQSLCDLFAKFDEDYEKKNIQKDFTEKDLFMRWQLVSRWTRGCEISNILGVYFDRNNIYIDNFSDICHRKFSRYGHIFGRDTKRENLGELAFDNFEDSIIFENIVKKAKELKPDTESIKLLCKLNKVKHHEVMDSFNATRDRWKSYKQPRWWSDRD